MRGILFALGIAAPGMSQAAWDPAPWLADLDQAHQAVEQKYANLDWLTRERGVDLDAMFRSSADRISRAGSDAGARAEFERLFTRFHDGHVDLRWPRAAQGEPVPPQPLCAKLGYDAAQASPGVSAHFTGYRALGGDNVFPAGTFEAASRRVGAVRIGVFQPQGYPALCEATVKALAIPADKPCDERCEDAILTWAYARLTADLEDRLRQLKAAGATVLLVDLGGNGGGSEWAEAAARTMSARPLTSAPLGFVRGPHWAKQWADLAAQLRKAAVANPQDRARLEAWAAEAEAAKAEADRPCAPRLCIGRAGFATGLVGSAPAGSFAGKDWAPSVFSAAQFPYHDGVWDGPVLVLVDQETWSAAEEFAAMLRDNGAAIIVGERTGGAGCGHTFEGTPTTLAHSGAVLELPDCVRFRRDGSNEVNGIVPDQPTGMRAFDPPALKARLIEARLPAAILQAESLSGKVEN